MSSYVPTALARVKMKLDELSIDIRRARETVDKAGFWYRDKDELLTDIAKRIEVWKGQL